MRKKFDEQLETKKALNYSTKDGVAATVAVSSGDNFVSAYAVALGASNLQIGLLSALPTLIPVELFTRKAMEKYPRKKIVLLGVLIQIIMYASIAIIGLVLFKSPLIAASLLIFLFSIYASVGLFMSPAWASWMKDLTDKIHRGKYFSMRHKIFGVIGIATIITCGLLLDYFKKIGYVFYGFAIIFLIAAIGRTISRFFMKKQYEPKLKLSKGYYFSFLDFIKKAPTNNYGRFVIFMALITFSVNLAAPFFAPYMLNSLKFSYFTFTLIHLIITGLATLLTMPFWGRFLDKYGSVRTMSVTVGAIPVIPLLWLVSPSPYWLIFVQLISGAIWAGFNLGAGTFTYDAVTKERMNLCVAYMAVLSGLAVFFGATIGGLLASLNIKFMNIFLFVFLISGIARLIVISVFFSSIKEVKVVKPAKPLLKIMLRPLRPLRDVLLAPFEVLHHSNVNKSNNYGSKEKFWPLANATKNKNS